MEKSVSKKTFYWIALVATIVFIGVQLYLNKHHLDLKLGLGSSQSICNVSDKLNCDTTASSRYAELFGVPMALLGAFMAGLLMVFILLARFNLTSDTSRTERFAFYTSTFMVLVSIVMGLISAFILKSACPFCIASYIFSVIIFAALFLAYRPRTNFLVDDIRDAFTSEKWILGSLISIPVLAFLVNNMTLDSYGFQEIKRVTQDSLENWKRAPEQNFDLTNALKFQNGTSEPKVVIVEFADFLCSHCRAAAPNLHNFAKSHPDVQLVFKSFPLDGVCNPAIPNKHDGKSCEYAYAAFCTEKIAQKGWEALTYFFDHQDSMFSSVPSKIVDDFCKASGADCPAIKTCMTSEEVHESVRKMALEGEKAQIGGTPSIFFNNRLLKGGQLPTVLENTYREYAK